MMIDFHTHVFPDALAPKAMAVLTENAKDLYTPVSDGTLAGLLRNMDAWGIDLSVIQPVVTKPTQTEKTNQWAAGIASGRVISFGGLYPHSDDWKEQINRIVELSLRGIKFHPEYQNFIVDEPKMLPIYDFALSKGLILLFHAGFDPAFPPPFKTSPQQFAHIAKEMQGGVMVAAHLGGQGQWEDVEKVLAGTEVYLDTSMGFAFYSEAQFLRIVRKHGADKILFGSDAPWSCAKTEIERIQALPLTETEKHLILGGNAQRILDIQPSEG